MLTLEQICSGIQPVRKDSEQSHRLTTEERMESLLSTMLPIKVRKCGESSDRRTN